MLLNNRSLAPLVYDDNSKTDKQQKIINRDLIAVDNFATSKDSENYIILLQTIEIIKKEKRKKKTIKVFVIPINNRYLKQQKQN